jgi:dCMP deaminase
MSQKWDAFFLGMAAYVATASKDPSSKVGAVIVRPDRSVASVGYNGFARGVEDSAARLGNRDTRLLFTAHAELNAILSAGGSVGRCTIYVWPYAPCAHCASAIIQAGIFRVVTPVGGRPERWKEHFEAADAMFIEAGIVHNTVAVS